MLDNLLSTVQEYVEKHKALDVELHKQDETNKKVFKDGIRFEKLGKLKEAYYADCKALHAEYEAKVKEMFQDAYADLRSATMTPVDQDMLNIIKLMQDIDDISEMEADSLFEATKNSYLANKRIHQFIQKIGKGKNKWEPYFKKLYGDDPKNIYFIPVDNVMGEVAALDEYLMNGIFGNSNRDYSFSSYNSRNILNGTYVNSVTSQGNHFMKRYAG